MKKLQLIWAVAIICSGRFASGDEIITKGHPRIYITPTEIPALRAKCGGPLKGAFQAMQEAEFIMQTPSGAGWKDNRNAGYVAFMYLITGEEKYLSKCSSYLDALIAERPTDKFLAAEWIPTGSMLLDWIWNDLSRGEREKYARTLLDICEWMLKRHRHSDFSNQFVLEHLSVIYVGVLLHGEDIDRVRSAEMLKTGRDYLLSHAVPGSSEIAGQLLPDPERRGALGNYRSIPVSPAHTGPQFVGGQAEGFSYNDWGYARPLALTCEMWRVATGQDLFANSSFFRGQGIWHAYGLREYSQTFARSEDCPPGYAPDEFMKIFMHLLAARLQDPLAEWVACKVKWRNVQRGWMELLWRDPELAPRSPKDLDLPLATEFGKLGHVYFRSGWGDKHSSFALFQCGPFYAGHQHLDNNTFVIHRTGSLAIESGLNEYSTHRGNYYCRTIAHNGIVVFDPTEQFSGNTWGSRGKGGSNDGGQIRRRGINRCGEFAPGCPADTPRIVAFASGAHCAAAAGDATRSYNPEKVSKVLRAFYHLRPGAPGRDTIETFVVYDRVAVTHKGLRPKWVIHSIERPQVNGNTFVITRESGRLLAQVILPSDAKIELIGGAGKEFFVDGKNYPPLHKRHAEAGTWRIEIELPPDGNLSSEALVLLHVSDAGNSRSAPSVSRLTDRAVAIAYDAGKPDLLTYTLFVGERGGSLPQVRVTAKDRTLETLDLGTGK